MVKKITLRLGLLLLSVGYGVFANAEIVREERDVSGFDAIDVSGAGTVNLKQGSSESLVIEADSDVLDTITTRVENGVLHIDRTVSSWLSFGSAESIVYHIQFKTLEGLALSGSIKAVADKVTTDQLKTKVSGSGELTIEELHSTILDMTVSGSGSVKVAALAADEFTGRVSGSGVVSVGGQVSRQNIRISGAGNFQAANLEGDTVDARISGAGNAEVWANEHLDVHISGDGGLSYRGEPNISKKLPGSGRISAAN